MGMGSGVGAGGPGARHQDGRDAAAHRAHIRMKPLTVCGWRCAGRRSGLGGARGHIINAVS